MSEHPPERLTMVSVRVPWRVVDAMDECAAKERITRSEWCRMILEGGLARYAPPIFTSGASFSAPCHSITFAFDGPRPLYQGGETDERRTKK